MSKRSSSKLSLVKGSKQSSSLLRNSKGSRTSKISAASETESYLERRDRFMRELWQEIYDQAFNEIYTEYLENQTRKLSVFCACEAALKIVSWEFLECDPGERLKDVDIFRDDKRPSLAERDVLMENGGESFTQDMMALLREPLPLPIVEEKQTDDKPEETDDLNVSRGCLKDIYKNEMF